jgi:FkbM family methyltransferase
MVNKSKLDVARNQSPSVIYDFGANNGINLPYYLKKAELVVAVEANPVLANEIKIRFADSIQNKNLVVEAVVLTEKKTKSKVPFFIHKSNHVLSQFPLPTQNEITSFEKIDLPAKTPADIIKKYGTPLFVKIDVEHYDGAILKSLFNAGIRPNYISAEIHDAEPLAVLIALGEYKAFKLVNSYAIEKDFANHPIHINQRTETFSFIRHSAGPFGEDLPDKWMTGEQIVEKIGSLGFGWRDLHATTEFEPSWTETKLSKIEVAKRNLSGLFNFKLRRSQ